MSDTRSCPGTASVVRCTTLPVAVRSMSAVSLAGRPGVVLGIYVEFVLLTGCWPSDAGHAQLPTRLFKVIGIQQISAAPLPCPYHHPLPPSSPRQPAGALETDGSAPPRPLDRLDICLQSVSASVCRAVMDGSRYVCVCLSWAGVTGLD